MPDPNPVPILSIVIPAFEYAAGVHRILGQLSESCPTSVEILIFDDSFSDKVLNVFQEWEGVFKNISYRRNIPTLGPSRNWNTLLESARGKYCLLMHHDEFPIGKNFLMRVLAELEKNSNIDVFVLDLILFNRNGEILWRNLPNIIRFMILKYYPAYMLRRNPIGPTSALIVRKNLYPFFDENLKWLVDVDVYYRLRKLTSAWKISSTIRIGSIAGRDESITANLGDKINKIRIEELAYLKDKYSLDTIWSHPTGHCLTYGFEAMFWVLMRVITRLWYFIIKQKSRLQNTLIRSAP